MKRSLLAAAALIAVGGAGGFAYQAHAASQTDSTAASPAPDALPPSSLPMNGLGGGPNGGPGGHWHHEGWAHGHGFARHAMFMRHMHDFGLFAPTPDKNLTAADVKVIAQALLLEHGNHDWTVSDVTAGANDALDFSYNTAHGDTVAKFSVDPKTGHLKRIG